MLVVFLFYLNTYIQVELLYAAAIFVATSRICLPTYVLILLHTSHIQLSCFGCVLKNNRNVCHAPSIYTTSSSSSMSGRFLPLYLYIYLCENKTFLLNRCLRFQRLPFQPLLYFFYHFFIFLCDYFYSK